MESLTTLNSQFVKFKRFNEKEEILANEDLMKILSAGTFRGVELYIRCIDALKYGKTIIIDEIEISFQKNLVYKLLFLFNDGEINSKGAQIIFSTHYVEILDYLSRRDNIYIAHKNGGRIVVNNLYMGYKVRTELLKSKQFNNNVFNTSFSYENLLALKQATHEELKVKE